MKSRVKMLSVAFVFLSCTAQQIQSLADIVGYEEGLTAEQVGAGLKEALVKGVSTGTEKVGKPGGYFKNPQIKILTLMVIYFFLGNVVYN